MAGLVEANAISSSVLVNSVASLARSRGIESGVVVVTNQHNSDMPVSIRSIGNQGWGDLVSEQEYLQQMQIASTSARYALAGRRTASKQRVHEKKQGRTPASYVPGLADDYKGRSVWMPDEQITVTVVSPRLNEMESEEMVLAAVTEKGEVIHHPHELSPGDLAISRLALELDDRCAKQGRTSGLVAIGLATLFEPRLSIVSLQAVGLFVEGLVDVVAAKGLAVAKTGGLLSGPDNHDLALSISRIKGGVLVEIGDGDAPHKRIVAVGGLKTGEDDIQVILDIAASVPFAMRVRKPKYEV